MFAYKKKTHKFNRWSYALELLSPYMIDNPSSAEMYSFDIAKIKSEKSLSSEEEINLFYKYFDGDEEALKQILKSNLKHVVSIVKQNKSPYLSESDSIIEGTWGLIKAAHRFDDRFKLKFIEFATSWIRENVNQTIDEEKAFKKIKDIVTYNE